VGSQLLEALTGSFSDSQLSPDYLLGCKGGWKSVLLLFHREAGQKFITSLPPVPGLQMAAFCLDPHAAERGSSDPLLFL
jgi:hypothetical protein